MPTPPALTNEQRRQAYEKALELRQRRSKVKQGLRRGDIDLGDAWGLSFVQGMKVYDLLVALPGIARARALKILAAAGIAENKTVRACGPKQRERLFSALR